MNRLKLNSESRQRTSSINVYKSSSREGVYLLVLGSAEDESLRESITAITGQIVLTNILLGSKRLGSSVAIDVNGLASFPSALANSIIQHYAGKNGRMPAADFYEVSAAIDSKETENSENNLLDVYFTEDTGGKLVRVSISLDGSATSEEISSSAGEQHTDKKNFTGVSASSKNLNISKIGSAGVPIAIAVAMVALAVKKYGDSKSDADTDQAALTQKDMVPDTQSEEVDTTSFDNFIPDRNEGEDDHMEYLP